jgi:hypothetical protein
MADGDGDGDGAAVATEGDGMGTEGLGGASVVPLDRRKIVSWTNELSEATTLSAP